MTQEANPSVSFTEVKTGVKWAEQFKEELSAEEVASMTLLNEYLADDASNIINVDITVPFLNHIGLEENGGIRTSVFIQKCLQEYPAMRKQVLLLKWILAAWDLNKTFTGKKKLQLAGLSSYCISLLVLAFLQHHQVKDHNNSAELFLDLIRYYGIEFDLKRQQIFPLLLER